MKICKKLQELRKTSGLSQAELSRMARVPLPTIRGLEQGRRLPSWPTLRRLSAALRVSLGGWEGLEDELLPPFTAQARRKAKRSGVAPT